MATTTPNPFRLPTNVLPIAYRVRLEPNLDDATFSGTVEIDVQVAESTTSIMLNAIELEIGATTVSSADGATTHDASLELHETFERATLNLPGALEPGKWVIRSAFTGILNDKLRGFYRSTFTDANDVQRTIATTQFESTDARRAFPCFDEPAMKATFEITLVIPGDLAAYSNSPVAAQTTLEDGRKEIRFAPTMKMSTYIVAFVVGPFESTSPASVDGVPHAIVYPPGKAHLTDFALEISAFALRYYSDYFGIPYPGEKVDHLAIPDFAAGAMENLGCITYRENALLIDPATASQIEIQRVAEVVAHELAHMWFGDLVTMDWWEGIWLNEAFATFMAEKCCDAFRPEWQRWISFGIARDMAMGIDSLHKTRPIEYEVISPHDAEGMFDLLTYEKGGAVLRMVEQYLGEEVFRDGIRHYLKNHSYANTVTSDLWAALEEVSGEPVAKTADTWILQGGHPVVTVEGGQISQAPFSFTAKTSESAIGSSWLVPVVSRSLGGTELGRQLLGEEPQALASSGPAIANAGGNGVYRTNYGTAELAAIAANLGGLDELERTVLINDTWAMVLAGRRDIADLLHLAKGLSGQVDVAAWTTVTQALGYLRRAALPEDVPAVEAAIRRLLGPELQRLGFDAEPGEDPRTPTLRGLFTESLGTSGGSEEVRAYALREFDSGTVEGDLATAILATVGAVNRPGDFDEVLTRFRDAADPQTENRYRRALGQFQDQGLVERTFELCFTEFRLQDVPIMVIQLLANRTGGKVAWELLTSKWDEMVQLMPAKSQSYLVASISTFIDDRAFAERVGRFHEDHPVASGQRQVDQMVERMFVGVDFAERVRPGLTAKLSS